MPVKIESPSQPLPMPYPKNPSRAVTSRILPITVQSLGGILSKNSLQPWRPPAIDCQPSSVVFLPQSVTYIQATDEDITMLLAAQCHIGSKNCEVFYQL